MTKLGQKTVKSNIGSWLSVTASGERHIAVLSGADAVPAGRRVRRDSIPAKVTSRETATQLMRQTPGPAGAAVGTPEVGTCDKILLNIVIAFLLKFKGCPNFEGEQCFITGILEWLSLEHEMKLTYNTSMRYSTSKLKLTNMPPVRERRKRGGGGTERRVSRVEQSAGDVPPPRNQDISVMFFLDTMYNFAFSNIFKMKWPKPEEKLNF